MQDLSFMMGVLCVILRSKTFANVQQKSKLPKYIYRDTKGVTFKKFVVSRSFWGYFFV